MSRIFSSKTDISDTDLIGITLYGLRDTKTDRAFFLEAHVSLQLADDASRTLIISRGFRPAVHDLYVAGAPRKKLASVPGIPFLVHLSRKGRARQPFARSGKVDSPTGFEAVAMAHEITPQPIISASIRGNDTLAVGELPSSLEIRGANETIKFTVILFSNEYPDLPQGFPLLEMETRTTTSADSRGLPIDHE
ncbi:MAG: hypothetical protein AAB229_07295 [Candidatus Hydrogenedentota bacterium]